VAIEHVRARCKTTGAIAAISARALDTGVFPDWERVDGPTPKRPKPAAFPQRSKTEKADSESADEKE
jgi:hypothetical protein